MMLDIVEAVQTVKGMAGVVSEELRHRLLILIKFFKFVVCNPRQSSSSILSHPCSFMVYCNLSGAFLS